MTKEIIDLPEPIRKTNILTKLRPLTRYSEEEFPSYRYVPLGRHPHPTMDHDGHMYGQFDKNEQLDEAMECAWMVNEYWLFGVDLFNHWYFWEAVEYWTMVWRSIPAEKLDALWLQSMIMLGGLMLKVHSGEEQGVTAFWGSVEHRLDFCAGQSPVLWGLKTQKVRRDFKKYVQPYLKGKALQLEADVPLLKLIL